MLDIQKWFKDVHNLEVTHYQLMTKMGFRLEKYVRCAFVVKVQVSQISVAFTLSVVWNVISALSVEYLNVKCGRVMDKLVHARIRCRELEQEFRYREKGVYSHVIHLAEYEEDDTDVEVDDLVVKGDDEVDVWQGDNDDYLE